MDTRKTTAAQRAANRALAGASTKNKTLPAMDAGAANPARTAPAQEVGSVVEVEIHPSMGSALQPLNGASINTPRNQKPTATGIPTATQVPLPRPNTCSGHCYLTPAAHSDDIPAVSTVDPGQYAGFYQRQQLPNLT